MLGFLGIWDRDAGYPEVLLQVPKWSSRERAANSTQSPRSRRCGRIVDDNTDRKDKAWSWLKPDDLPPIKGSSASVSTIRSATVVRQRYFRIFWAALFGRLREAIVRRTSRTRGLDVAMIEGGDRRGDAGPRRYEPCWSLP